MPWYVKFDDVSGSAKNKRYQQWSKADYISLGGKRPQFGGQGIDRRIRSHFDDVTIGVIRDRSIPKLIEAATKGEVFDRVEICGTRLIGKQEFTYLQIELTKAQVTGFQLGVLDTDRSTDDVNLTLDFENSKVQEISLAT